MIELLTFLSVYIVYHLTSIPSVPGGDSGELLAESCIRGVAHPPGYPLFIMLSNLVQLFRVPRLFFSDEYLRISVDYNATKAWKVNHLCCVFGAMACVLVGKSAKIIATPVKADSVTKNENIGNIAFLISATMYSFSPLIWEYSVTAEVFALNNLLCALLLYLTCVLLQPTIWESRSCYYILGFGALTSGLALSNQHASLLEILPLVSIALFAYIKYLKPTLSSGLLTLSFSGVAFFVGLSPYIYLYFAAMGQRRTPGTWGNTGTLSGLLMHMLRSEYGTFKLGMIEGSEGFSERVAYYLAHASAQSYHVVLEGLLILIASVFITAIKQMKTSTDRKAFNASLVKSKSATKKSTISQSANKGDKNTIPAAPPDVIACNNNTMGSVSIALLILSWIFYVVVWHGVLSNLPLSSPMPYGVHSRFWMQPDILLYALSGAGLALGSTWVLGKAFAAISLPIVIIAIASVLYHRFPLMDRSKSGWIIHQYGEHILDSLPPNSLLLSHTDLDWNPIRYLRLCEGKRPDVTHLSFQLMPFPWFKDRQQPLYPSVAFPDLSFPGVSTNRGSAGNAELVRRVLLANNAHRISTSGQAPPSTPLASAAWGGIFVDMQAISEVEIEYVGAWRGLILLPWGTVYRVYGGNLTLAQVRTLHPASYAQLQSLRRSFPEPSESSVRVYPAGSWESAATNVYYDAHYQLALHLLTFSLEVKVENPADLTLALDRAAVAADLLAQTQAAVRRFGTISSAVKDIDKNTALAWMKAYLFAKIAAKFQREVTAQLNDASDLLERNRLSELMNSGSVLERMKAKAGEVVKTFVENYRDDKDQPIFSQFLKTEF